MSITARSGLLGRRCSTLWSERYVFPLCGSGHLFGSLLKKEKDTPNSPSEYIWISSTTFSKGMDVDLRPGHAK